MEAIRQRRTEKSCQSFYRHFGKPKGKTVTIKKDASTYDTMRYLSKVAPSDAARVKPYAKHLKSMGLPLKDLCKVIWNDLFGCVDYGHDEFGYEQVRSPERLISDAIGDCDCYTRFLNAVFHSLGIPALSRKADYGSGWQHVYLIVPTIRSDFFNPRHPTKDVMKRNQYIVIDPVAKRFDTEKSYQRKFDSMAELQSLEGYGRATETGKYSPSHLAIYQPDGNGMAGNSYPLRTGKELNNTELFQLYCSYIPHEALQGFPSGLAGSDELGFFKKIGKFVKKTVDKVGDTAAGKVFRKARDGVRYEIDKVGETAAGRLFRRVRDHVREAGNIVFKFVNRYFNPAAILLRNGFLLGMKLDIMNAAEKLRFAYLSDSQLRNMGFANGDINSLRSGLRRAEKIFEGAGGKSRNLKNAILNGKGNKDGRVNLHAPTEASDDPNEAKILDAPWQETEIMEFQPVQYKTEDGKEYLLNEKGEMIRLDDTMGEPATGTAIAIASGAIAAVASLVQGVVIPAIQQKRQDELVRAQVEQIKGGNRMIPSESSLPPASSNPMNNKKTALVVGSGVVLGLTALYLYRQKSGNSKKALSGIKRKTVKSPKKPKRVVKTIDFSS